MGVKSQKFWNFFIFQYFQTVWGFSWFFFLFGYHVNKVTLVTSRKFHYFEGNFNIFTLVLLSDTLCCKHLRMRSARCLFNSRDKRRSFLRSVILEIIMWSEVTEIILDDFARSHQIVGRLERLLYFTAFTRARLRTHFQNTPLGL